MRLSPRSKSSTGGSRLEPEKISGHTPFPRPTQPYHTNMNDWVDTDSTDWKSVDRLLGVFPDDSMAERYGFSVEPTALAPDIQLFKVGSFPVSQFRSGLCNLIDLDATVGSSFAVPKIVRTIGRIYETLAAVPSTSVIPASGQYLQDIESANAELQLVKRTLLGDYLTHFLASPDLQDASDSSGSTQNAGGAPDWTTYAGFGVTYSTEEPPPLGATDSLFSKSARIWRWLRSLHSARAQSGAEGIKSYFETLLKRLRRSIRKKARTIRRSFFRPLPRFCGLAWSARSWCLLHGGHPPKVASLPA